eukprot:30884-Pelagococcus_subviridis.AAC.3
MDDAPRASRRAARRGEDARCSGVTPQRLARASPLELDGDLGIGRRRRDGRPSALPRLRL